MVLKEKVGKVRQCGAFEVMLQKNQKVFEETSDIIPLVFFKRLLGL